MIGLLVVLFPVLLLGFMLFMQRVEEPLDRVDNSRDIERMLDERDRGDMEVLAARGADSAVDRYRARRRWWRRRGAR